MVFANTYAKFLIIAKNFGGDEMFEISIREVPLVGIKTPEQLAAFVLSSLGLTSKEVEEADVKMLLAFLKNKEGLKVKELIKEVGLKQTATYARLKKFVNAGLVYKSKGSIYKLRENTLAETLKFRVWREIEKVFSGIVEVAEELDKKLREARKQEG